MKVATVEHNGAVRIGIVVEDDTALRLLPPETRDMHEMIGAVAPDPDTLERVALKDVTLKAPIAPRRNIMCVGKNYSEHAREFARSGYEAGAVAGKDMDDHAALFSKLPSTVIGQNAPIELHPGVTEKVDYEAELAVIIGKGGRGIDRADAYNHVWGYTIMNDVTARDLQRNHKQWFLGKSLDTFAPLGPWIVTADEIEPEALQVQARVNGDLRQDANTRDFIHTIPDLIATLSAGITLQPGDVIATGTPAGVGIGMDPPQFLQPGDEVAISISGIGTLTNRCV